LNASRHSRASATSPVSGDSCNGGVRRPTFGQQIQAASGRPSLTAQVALGDCHRPYGTPCVHEHACSRCRFLRVDPAQFPRIEEMTCNAEARLAEAQDRAWLGEVAALEESLKHLQQRRAEAENRLPGVVSDLTR
jgi:hypothetical protein